MKILILSVSDKRHMPMVAPYIDYLEKKNIAYDIIRANRYISTRQRVTKTARLNGCDYEINMLMPMDWPKYRKARLFLRFYLCAVRIMKQNQYEYVIIWNENTAVLFSAYLSRNYPDRYCINIRDPISDLGFFGHRVIKAINKSHFSTVPSPDSEECKMKFRKRVIVVYNKDYDLLSKWTHASCKRVNLPIRLTHLGFYSKAVKGSIELADLFGNDERFELSFCGAGFDKDFQNYISMCGYKNIYTTGAFETEKTKDYLENTDIINSYYNMFNQVGLQSSFGIKHSYIPMLHIPGLVDENTTFGKMAKPYNIAFLVNDENLGKLPDLLFEWYKSLNFDTFIKNCNKFNNMIDDSILHLYELLDERIKT